MHQMKFFLSLWTPLKTITMTALPLLALCSACSDGGGAPNRTSTLMDTGASSENSATSVTGANATGTGGTQSIDLSTAVADGAGGTMTETECDATGMNCTCINVALIGRLGSYGATPGADGTASMETWLNDNSNGDAATILNKPTLNEEFLSQYDVVILQALENAEGAGQQWQFSAEELAAFEAWVRAGGGVVALTGYGGLPDEVTPTNQLLTFSGLQYAGLSGPGDTMNPGTCPDECCYCNGNSIPSTGWDANHPISANVTAVGAFYGRSITVPANGAVVAQAGGVVLGATVEVDMGRVFMFHDEWVTYNSQWTGADITDDCRTTDPNHSCYNRHPLNDYQVPQFWYNAIRWVSNRECFDADDPLVEIIK
jgi:hypothetical protein